MAPTRIVSQPYTIRRMELSLIASVLYVRTFWWMLIGMPISGVLILLLLQNGAIRAMAVLMIVWPLTIPSRAGLVNMGLARRYRKPIRAIVTDDALYIEAPVGKGTKVPFAWIRRVWVRGDIWVVIGSYSRFVLVRATAFEEADRTIAMGLLNASTG
jgi:hypothetical protein